MNYTNAEIVLTLLSIKNVGIKTVYQLISQGIRSIISDEDILNLIVSSSKVSKRIKSTTMDDLLEAKNKANKILEECSASSIGVLTILDQDFPNNLRSIENPPVVIYYKGNKECLLKNDSIAIIGTRTPTQHGSKIARRLGYIFAKEDFIVVSGLAKGCDEMAHIGCLEGEGKTIAVLPGGINNIYPESNKYLANDIISKGGCLISEYEPNSKVQKHFFVVRDRLQSGLSQGIIVVESKIKSGTMHTVNFAASENKIIGCYKHPEAYIGEEQVQGNLELLKLKNTLQISNNDNLSYFKYKLKNQDSSYSKNDSINQITFHI